MYFRCPLTVNNKMDNFFRDMILHEESNESLTTDLSKSDVSIVSNFCDDKKLELAFLSLPILLISLAIGIFIKRYHGSLDEIEKNIVVFFDIAITNYLQESFFF